MSNCNLCPNKCNADRDLRLGACNSSSEMRIAKYYLHPFEEPCISLGKGSGTVFFCGCSLGCVFCQNYEISHSFCGTPISPNRLADIFCELENSGAENINLVNPTHFADKIAEAVKIRKPNIPIVYNTHGYESEESLKIADSYTDIYLTDLKYCSPFVSLRYTNKKDYFLIATKAIEFMANTRKTSFNGEKMMTGTIVRHLILPQNSRDSIEILKWFSEKVKDKCILSLMSQYTPYGSIENYPELQRKITRREYNVVFSALAELNIENCYIQKESSSSEKYIPTWDLI